MNCVSRSYFLVNWHCCLNFYSSFYSANEYYTEQNRVFGSPVTSTHLNDNHCQLLLYALSQ